MENFKSSKFTMFLFFLGIIILVQLIGGWFTSFSTDSEWYRNLEKSNLNPPNWVFPAVWTILYLMMAVSIWLVWEKLDRTDSQHPSPYVVFGVQLFLNLIWSAIFFTFRSPFWALIDIFALLIAIAATIKIFLSIRPLAGWLLVPYFIWVAFAAYLNYVIWMENA